VCFTKEVLRFLDSNEVLHPSVDVLDAAYVSLNQKLKVLSWEDFVAEVFSAERMTREGGTRCDQAQQRHRMIAMWTPLSTHDVFGDLRGMTGSPRMLTQHVLRILLQDHLDFRLVLHPPVVLS
jgi:hypothetical protein